MFVGKSVKINKHLKSAFVLHEISEQIKLYENQVYVF